VSNFLTDSRVAIMAKLASDLTANGRGFDVIPGERDGVSRDRNLACVWAPPMRTANNVSFANPVLMVRAWVRQPKPPKPTSPQNPEPVEQLMVDIAGVLAEVQVPAELGVYWIVQEIVPDYADWGVQVPLLGWTINPATVIT
jgi:hypothetical protein